MFFGLHVAATGGPVAVFAGAWEEEDMEEPTLMGQFKGQRISMVFETF